MKRKVLFFALMLLASAHVLAQSITITESVGWLESAYIKWQALTGATSYNVYFSGNGIANQKIDNQLIRSYGTYYRADVLGLAAGTYTIKVTPVVSGVEGTATSTGALTVLAHDRTGFAFDGGRVPGAYKADGTPKDGAVILYITENTKNTISMTVTGANANPCVGLETIMEAFGKGKDTRPLIVRLIGNITDYAVMADGDILIENNQNASCSVTAEGVGDDAVCNGWSFRVKGATNVEIRNLAAMNCNSTAGDDFGLQQDNDHIWVHNCDMFYGDAGSDADQIKGDGACDIKGSTYITISYNHFHDNGKSSLLGLSENTTTGLYITYHHNWFDHSDSRHPRVRFYTVHFYNNYLDGNSKYGAGSTMGSSLFVEGNYFRNCKHPMMTSMQGTDVWNSSTLKNDPANMGTFSNEDGGTIKAFHNTFDASIGTNNMRFVAYGDPSVNFNIAGVISSTIDFDAYVAQTRSEQVPATVKSFQGANVYNNFDMDAGLYVKDLVIDEPAVAVAKDTIYGGRVKGGDFKWYFTNSVDDVSSLVNTPLKTAITNYKTSLVSVQGESSTTGSSQTLTSTTNNNQTVVSGTAITSIVFTWGGDATDAAVTGLPASGISFAKDASAKTITISGTPTATLSYSIATTGSAGTSVTLSGTITVTSGGTPSGSMVHNFTASGTTSTFYAITGNLSTNYGSATYGTLTLTQCLKMESSTNIAFTTTDAGTLTLVFGSTYSGAVSVDGTSYTPVSGIVTVTLAAGVHTVKKVGTNYLFYMSVVYNNSSSTAPTITATTPAARCDAGTVTLGATASAGIINWYAAATGGLSLGTGTSFTTPGISATTSYFVDATASSLTTATRTEIVATIRTKPTIVATAPASRNDAGTVTLGAIASAGTINWYAAATGGASLGTGTSFTTPVISATTPYFVDATANACTTSLRTEIIATVNITSANTTGVGQIQNTGAAILRIYPNPVSETLTISSDNKVERIEIYSSIGLLVKSVGANIKTIDMSKLSQGCYLVRILTEHGALNRTVIKK
jgi:pectate lyase